MTATVKHWMPDIGFGVVDNGLLIIGAVIGADLGGVFGAVLGGALGNAVSDFAGGLLEGWLGNRFERTETVMSSSLGKFLGCMLVVPFCFLVD